MEEMGKLKKELERASTSNRQLAKKYRKLDLERTRNNPSKLATIP
jgi:hypothetical protein